MIILDHIFGLKKVCLVGLENINPFFSELDSSYASLCCARSAISLLAMNDGSCSFLSVEIIFSLVYLKKIERFYYCKMN